MNNFLGMAVCVAILSLQACALPPRSTTIMTRGEQTQPLQGWVEYCQRHPEDQSCPQQ